MAGQGAPWLDDALSRVAKARVGVLGDFCLDAYWQIDPDRSERSVETHRPVQKVRFQQYSLGGAALATFGDGPVEIRETRKRGGVAVGVASDEVRRFGLNAAKRSLLLRAGADLIVPDFTQRPQLLATLGLG